MFEIIPSPGTQDHEWTTIQKKIELVKPFVKTIHIDICDGKFAPNTTFAKPEAFKQLTNDLLFEVHLMVEEPNAYGTITNASVDADFGSGRTTTVHISGDGGSDSFSASEFKDFFNLRAPANINIVGSLYNIETK